MIHSAGINPLNAKLNPICHLLTLLGADPIFHTSRIRVRENENATQEFDQKTSIKGTLHEIQAQMRENMWVV